MKPSKILAPLLATVIALSACTSAPPAQETDGALAVTESTSPSNEPATEPPAPSTDPTVPPFVGSMRPYTPEEKAHFDSLRLPFDEVLTFYMEPTGFPAAWITKISIAPSGTEDWTELTCTGYCNATNPHSPYSLRQYQVPYETPDKSHAVPYRIKIEVDMENEKNIERGVEYQYLIIEDIYITDEISVLIRRRSSYNEDVWVEDYVGKYFCDYCYDRFGITDPPPRYLA